MKNLKITQMLIGIFLLVITLVFVSCQQNAFWYKLQSDEKKIFSKPYVINDTLRTFLEEGIMFNGMVDLGFCANELIAYLDEDTTYQKELEENICATLKPTDANFPKEGRYVFNNEYRFLKERLLKVDPRLQNLDSYCRLMAQLDTMEVIPIKDAAIINLMHQFERADGVMPWEYSGIYYSLLVQKGSAFIDIIRQDEKATELFTEWIKKIERYEFVAYGAGNLPPQIIERRRAYLLEILDKDLDANEVNKLTYNSIKYAKLRLIE